MSTPAHNNSHLMPSTRLYAVRHGESIWNVEGRLAGWTDIELTERGRAQASALRPLLQARQFDSVWSSPLLRARDTALLAWGNHFAEDELLKEFHFGDDEGRLLQDLSKDDFARFKRFSDYQPPGGERGEDFFARVDRFLHALPTGEHLAFTHGGVIRRLFERGGLRRFPGNAGIYVFDLQTNTLVEEIPNPI